MNLSFCFFVFLSKPHEHYEWASVRKRQENQERKTEPQVSSLRPSSWGGCARTSVAAANSYNHTNNTNKSTHQPIRRKASALQSQTLQVVPGLRRWPKKNEYQHPVLNASESPECNNAVCGCRADNKHFREALSVSHPELFAAETLKTL